MLTLCVRNVLFRSFPSQSSSDAVQLTVRPCSSSRAQEEDLHQTRTLLRLCVDRYFLSPGEANMELFRRGMSCRYGPLGTELRRNLLEQWWHSVSRTTAQVFGINTLSSSSGDTATGAPRKLNIVENEHIKQILEEKEVSKDLLIQKIQVLLQRSPTGRTSCLQGALEQFVPSLELVNRKLPFGLAETGLCFHPGEVTRASLVWFCSARASSQWLDHWTRQRLKWWRKFALSPSDFSSSDVPEEELEKAASRGVRIIYSFPWGRRRWRRCGTEETLSCCGHTEEIAPSCRSCRDGRKSVPHVISVTANVDRGALAFLSNSLQTLKKEDSRQRLQQRKVLKLHPVLAPVKVALDIGRGASVELRQVCEGLLKEFMEAKISTWPGYLETSAEADLFSPEYDEMGVLFTVVVNENTLESGLLQVRSRDTTVRETMHISEIKKFLSRYITAADNV
uniref:Polymerase (DNA directed), gamma 2, accessory subunit n=1 Tax=Labrus bergylta TaxID=56723 RepID=A0A3Q3M5Z1_9LABR